MEYHRPDHEPPLAIEKWGWRYHHLGIPTRASIPGEQYLAAFKLYRGGFDTSPFGVEWMRYEKDSPVPELIQSVPHLAFEVENLEAELTRRNFQVITPPNSPGEGVRVAMIEYQGAVIELIEFEKS